MHYLNYAELRCKYSKFRFIYNNAHNIIMIF